MSIKGLDSGSARKNQSERSLLPWLTEPVDISSIVFFRIAFGFILLVEVFRYFWNGWIGSVFIAPAFHFKYFGFEWVQPWPSWGMYVHFFVMGVLATLILVGWKYRTACFLFSACCWYVLFLDRAHYLNHFYLVCQLGLLMGFIPANRAFAMDALHNPQLRSDFVPKWTLWALRLQIAIPYVYGGIAKLNGDWLQGQPMQMWMSRMGWLKGVVPFLGERWLALLVSYSGLLIDLFILPLVLWKRTRWIALAVAIAFHLCNAMMFRIGIFPWLMICATTLFLPPDWHRRVFFKKRQLPNANRAISQDVPYSTSRLTTVALAAFFVIQMLVPFRHWLYPGNVDWTEEGSRFAWRMMLCDKAGAFRVTLFDPQTERQTPVDPRVLLGPEQLDRLSREPQMQHEFAVFLKRELARQGAGHMEVRFFSLCSLNGRRAQLLVNPGIDLGAQPRTLAPSPWIVPLTEPLPAEPWLVPQSEWEKHIKVSTYRADTAHRKGS